MNPMNMSKALDLVARVDTLVSLPAVYVRVKAVVDNPASTTQDMASALLVDPALVMRLLRIVNSVQFGLMRRIDSVPQAITLLGLQQVHDLVLSSVLAATFRGLNPAVMDMRKFWSQSVQRALLAQGIAESCRMYPPQRMFLGGLLADVGHLVMFQTVPNQAERAMMRSETESRPLHLLEIETVGCNYAEVAAALIDHWRLPHVLRDAVAAQIEPELAPDSAMKQAAVMHLARVITDGLARDMAFPDILERVSAFVWPTLDIGSDSLPGICTRALESLDEILSIFFPDIRAAA